MPSCFRRGRSEYISASPVGGEGGHGPVKGDEVALEGACAIQQSNVAARPRVLGEPLNPGEAVEDARREVDREERQLEAHATKRLSS